jgi:LAO/AO transport system kinase
VPELWGAVEKYFEHVRSNGSFDHRRSDQAVHWMRDLVRETLLRRWRSKPGLAELQADLEKSVRAGRITPRSAAERLIEA